MSRNQLLSSSDEAKRGTREGLSGVVSGKQGPRGLTLVTQGGLGSELSGTQRARFQGPQGPQGSPSSLQGPHVQAQITALLPTGVFQIRGAGSLNVDSWSVMRLQGAFCELGCVSLTCQESFVRTGPFIVPPTS